MKDLPCLQIELVLYSLNLYYYGYFFSNGFFTFSWDLTWTVE